MITVTKSISDGGEPLAYEPEARAVWPDSHIASLARIEERLTSLGNQTAEILQTLDYIYEKHFRPMEAKPAATGAQTALADTERTPRGRGIEALIPAAGKQSSPKRSA